MTHDTDSSCTDTAVTELVALFGDDLAAVSFPGVDAATLGAAVATVAKQADEVARLHRAHVEAVDALHVQQRALHELARQAHAYARVYAADNTALADRLDHIVLDPPLAAPPKKRRRRAKAAAKTPQLALDNASAAPAPPATSAAQATPATRVAIVTDAA